MFQTRLLATPYPRTYGFYHKEQCLGDVDMAVTARQVERRVTSLVDGINIAARRDMLREGRLLVLYSREMQWGLQ